MQIVLAAAMVLFGTSSLTGQIRSGTIAGRVVDPTGAPVPGVSVTILALETNNAYDATTNPAGEFSVSYLAAGRYRITVAQAGFATAQTAEMTVGTAQTVRTDIKLELATVSSTVEIAAATAEIQTESATVQNVITERVVQAIPNINHNSFLYATLQPGVVQRATMNDSQGGRAFGIGYDARRQFSAISVNGGQAFTNEIQLDGVSVTSATTNEASVLPNPDGLMEVRTLVNNYSAEYGRGQGVIAVTTKNGTNEFHALASYRMRNEALNANSFGANARGIARPDFKVGTYGGTFGGPIKKDKLFFFVSYQGLTHNQNLDFFATVPTDLERKGDFSKTLVNVSGVPTLIKFFDPFSVTQLQPNVEQRAPVPGSIVPNPDPSVLKMFSFYPQPNRTPQDVYNTNNYYRRGLQTFRSNNVNSRVDYRWRSHSFYGAAGLSQGTIDASKSWGPDNPFHSGVEVNLGGQGTSVTDNNPYVALGDTVVLSPTLVLDLRYGLTRINTTNELAIYPDFNYDQFGIPKSIQAINPTLGNPPASGWGGSWTTLMAGSPHNRIHSTNHSFSPSLTKTMSHWTLKFGGDYRVYLSNYFSGKVGINYASSPNYTRQMINASGTGIGVVTPDVAGYGPASLLLGAGTLEIATSSGLVRPNFAHKYGALFAQADWRATPRMTVNFGLRWDVQPGATDRYNNFCGFDETGTNPFKTQGAVTCAGLNGNGRNIYKTEWNNYGPRVGLAYRLSDTFVVRAGYGLMYLPSNTGYRNTQFVWGMDTFQAYTNNDPFGSNPNGTLIGRFNSEQVNRIVAPVGGDINSPSFYGGARAQRFPNHFPTQNAQQWNLFLEKRLRADWLLTAGYSASKGSHLIYMRVPLTDTQLLPQSLLDSWRQSYIQSNGLTNPGTVQAPNPFQPAGGPLIPFIGNQGRATLTPAEALLPYPLFASTQLQRPIGWSNYNSMVVQIEHRFAKGLQLSMHYTWSKANDFTETEAISSDFFDNGRNTQDSGSWWDLRNWRNNYTVSTFDVPHRAVLTYLYELPFGRGRSVNVQNRFLSSLVSGWQTGGTAVFQSGIPIQLTGASNGALNGRPNRVAGAPVEVPKELQRWYDGNTTVSLPDGRKITPCAFCFLKFNPDAFQGQVVKTPNGSYVNDIYWFGSAPERYADIRGPGVNNWNMTLARSFHPKERLTVDFAANFSNTFNHTQFRPAMNGALGNTSVQANSPLNIQPGQGQSSTFGTRGTDTYDPRQVELQLKVRF